MSLRAAINKALSTGDNTSVDLMARYRETLQNLKMNELEPQVQAPKVSEVYTNNPLASTNWGYW